MAGGIIGSLVGAGLGEIVKPIAEVVGKFIPDADKASEFTFELQRQLADRDAARDKAWADVLLAQSATNQIEAANPSLFVSGWRPAVGWTCVAGLVCGLILQPTAAWLVGLLGVILGAQLPAPPEMDLDTVTTLLIPLLGIGALRTYEKVKGVPDSTVRLPLKK